MRTIETTTPIETRQPMRFRQRLARELGGYALGFTGMMLEAGGIATINPIVAAIGAGAVYLGHRVIEPAHDALFGEHPDTLPKYRRAARFNVSLLPTYIGASLLSAGILGGKLNGSTLKAGERIAMGAVGFPTLLAGGAYERHLHLGGSLIPGLTSPTTPATDESDPLSSTPSLFTRIQDAFKRGYMAGRGNTTDTAA